jgi:hypothetical protein
MLDFILFWTAKGLVLPALFFVLGFACLMLWLWLCVQCRVVNTYRKYKARYKLRRNEKIR